MRHVKVLPLSLNFEESPTHLTTADSEGYQRNFEKVEIDNIPPCFLHKGRWNMANWEFE